MVRLVRGPPTGLDNKEPPSHSPDSIKQGCG
jgi:hypothetical protein